MKKVLFIFLLLCLNCQFFYSQPYRFVRSFNTDNSGIVDNAIYDIEEDNNGFLWIATENGISRFDGKNFFNYSVKDGLPSNEILSIAKELDGRIWVNCFRQPPAYFDVKLNRFVCQRIPQIEKNATTLLEHYIPLQGGIVFFNREMQLYYQHGKLKKIQKQFLPSIADNYNFYEIIHPSNVNFFVSKNKRLFPLNDNLHYYLVNKKVFGMDYKRHNSISQFSAFSPNSPFYKEDKIDIPGGIKWKKFYNNRLLVASHKNILTVIDLNDFRIIKEITVPEDINNAFIDSEQNLWISIKNGGMHLYKSSDVTTLPIKAPSLKQNFTSIATFQNKDMFAGNSSGQILQIKSGIVKQFLDIGDKEARMRKILEFNRSSFAISDLGYIYQSNKINKIYENGAFFGALKTAEKLNDSVAILGGLRGVVLVNVNNRKIKKLSIPQERITSIEKINSNQLLICSAKGLYIYNLDNDTHKIIQKKYIYSEAIAYLDLYFVSTILGEIEVYKNQKWIQTIKNSELLPSTISKIKIINNALWIGGKDGLYKMDFWLKNEKLDCKISKFTQNDGLVSNGISDFAENGNKIFVATDKGISVIDKNIKTQAFGISPQLIAIEINGKKVPINSQYQLKKDQNNIAILLSAVELSGHAKQLQYCLNNDGNWIPLNSNMLNLRLESGITKLIIRAIDYNNRASTKIKNVVFDVEIPVYERFWFWFLMSGLFFGIFITLYSYWKFYRQKEFYQHRLALESQRRKITADLHDDLGATLSSLQINSAVARKLMDDDNIQAKKILSKIERQAQKISENIGDTIWSLKPGKDEFMSLSTRIKNFANEVLGSQDIAFKISIDKSLNTEIRDFTLRKNLLLICKEALNNIAKYSKASQVKLSLVKEENYYLLQISDNGIGFNQTETKGNGLQNMEKRTQELGGTFKISSENGTQIDIKIPIIKE